LAVAGVVLFGFVIATIGRAVATVDPARKAAVIAERTGFAAGLIMAGAFVFGIFYSLDALHGERRDRSILFWKSLPVSDLTTVLCKASIPLVVLPLLALALTISLQIVMLFVSAAVLWLSGVSAGTPWAPPLFQMELVQLYSVIVLALWH